MEEFFDIPGLNGRFQASRAGKIKSVGRYIKNAYSGYVMTGRILSVRYDKRGYERVFVTKETNKKGSHSLVHRLIAATFIDNPENKRTVNHKNGIKTDNRVENLEWATDAENMKHAFKMGLKTNAGKNNPMYGRVGESAPSYGKRGSLSPNFGKSGIMSATAKLILDYQTGVFYHGVTEAAFAKNTKPFTLYGKLNGRRKNDTSLAYV